jgi:penicillin amidase
MLLATTVAELHETQREWVDPVNNLVSADTAGNIGYLTRGYLPVRSSAAHRLFPAPGWTGEHEWTGRVPFERLPQAINPPEGFIATANQAVVADDDLYIAQQFSPPFRAERIVEGLTGSFGPARRSDPWPSPAPPRRLSPQEIAALQGDTTSRAARAWVRRLADAGPYEGPAEAARALLAAWDGDLRPESGAALLYGAFRRTVADALFAPLTGEAAWRWLLSIEGTTSHAMISRWMARAVYALGGATTPDGRPWDEVLRPALAAAWRRTSATGGPDPARWRWDAHHATAARHPLAARFPAEGERLHPPPVAVGGDGDTLQAASYIYGDLPAFPIVGLSVYRQVVDLGDVARGSFVVPGGASGDPGSPHYADQLEPWRTHRRVPMHYAAEDVQAHAVHRLTLAPVVSGQ